MIDRKTLEAYQEKGLPMLKDEYLCPLYSSVTEKEGECMLDDLSVNIGAGCFKPRDCTKLEQRGIEVISIE